MAAQLLGQRRVQHRLAVVRPTGDLFLGLLPDFGDQPVDVLLDVAGVEDRLGVQPLEDGPALGGIQNVLRLVHAELIEDRRQLLFEDFLHPQFHAVLEDQVERLHRELLADTIHTPDALLDPHRVPGQDRS